MTRTTPTTCTPLLLIGKHTVKCHAHRISHYPRIPCGTPVCPAGRHTDGGQHQVFQAQAPTVSFVPPCRAGELNPGNSGMLGKCSSSATHPRPSFVLKGRFSEVAFAGQGFGVRLPVAFPVNTHIWSLFTFFI